MGPGVAGGHDQGLGTRTKTKRGAAGAHPFSSLDGSSQQGMDCVHFPGNLPGRQRVGEEIVHTSRRGLAPITAGLARTPDVSATFQQRQGLERV